jgi:hypothetical protein
VAKALQGLLTTTADAAAAESGFVQRARKVTGANFVQALVFGWLGRPGASLGELAQAAATCGLAISAQGLAQRFTERAADCLGRVLGAALGVAVAASAPVPLALLARFNGVYISDSTTVMLPDCLAGVWAGCGGRVATNTQAGLKVHARWELASGQLALLPLTAARTSDQAADEAAPPLPAGALRLLDLGYITLRRLGEFLAQGVGVVCRLPARPALFDGESCRWEVGALLALADWDAYITTVGPDRLTLAEGLALARARWQVALLFKLWKQHGRLDAWRSAKPWRILSEVYAKLVALLIQHWCLLLAAWADPRRSLVKAAQLVRAFALLLALARGHLPALRRALAHLADALPRVGHVATRRQSPATAHRLLALQEATMP